MVNLPSKPFETAERYINLRKKCAPESWVETINLMSDMILMPIIILFLALIQQSDPMTIIMTGMKAYQTWKEYTEYTELRFEVQRMFLHCQMVGGPFIVTNNSVYMPYVFADAVVRTSGSQ